MKTELERYVSQNPVTLRLFPEEKTKTFKSFSTLFSYIKSEVSTWKRFTNINVVRRNTARFQTALEYFERAYNRTTPDEIQKEINDALQLLRDAPSGSNAFVYSHTRAGTRLLSLCENSRSDEYISAFNQFVNTGIMGKLNRKERVLGLFDAYRTLYPDVSSKTIEERDLELQRLSETYHNSVEEIVQQYVEHWQKVDSDYTTYAEEMSMWQEKHKEELQGFIEEKQEALSLLENTYKNKLSLEAPVEYWKKSKEANKKTGTTWVALAVILSVLIAGYIMLVISDTFLPDALKGDMSIFNAASIRSTLLITAGVSVLVYLLRIFIKMALSSFHLSKDASERETLTYLFLSLTNDGKISDAERAIVLQALFSRADTGLLKGDSSPSFSNEGIMSIISKCVGGKT